jgi:hypothetical protein
MHTKLRQLVISALKRNDQTAKLPLTISLKHYQVVVSGEVASDKTAQEVVNTIESVSPYLQVQSRLTIAERPALH